MKPITMYEANDGSRHTTAHAAEARDVLILQCNDALLPLGLRPALRYRIGATPYWQHTAEAVREAKRSALVLLSTLYGKSYPQIVEWQATPDEVHPMGFAGRIASEGPEPLARAWQRLACIDEQGREWEQPYFANHTPDDAVSVNAPASVRG